VAIGISALQAEPSLNVNKMCIKGSPSKGGETFYTVSHLFPILRLMTMLG
jgi:hypothetical protein